MSNPRVVVLGGPNGAGKSTFAQVYLHEKRIQHFVNADEIARGLSAFNPEKVAMEAGRVMLKEIRNLAVEKTDFAFETTLASRSFHSFIKSLNEKGYEADILYLWLPDPKMAVERVHLRVKRGGHSVPDEVIHRRYWAGLRNFFELYRLLAFSWAFYDNSMPYVPELIAKGGRDVETEIFFPELWHRLEIKDNEAV